LLKRKKEKEKAYRKDPNKAKRKESAAAVKAAAVRPIDRSDEPCSSGVNEGLSGADLQSEPEAAVLGRKRVIITNKARDRYACDPLYVHTV
jgi:hypothetical protein